MLTLLLIVLGALILFFTEWVEVEITAILVMAALLVTGILEPAEALSGFSSEATVVVAGLLIMSSAIERTGALQVAANRFMRWAKGDPHRVATSSMFATGVLSMFLNNTPAVAVQLPIALSVARKAEVAVSKLLMPISFAAILGGTCTMIGTSTNLLVRSIAADHGWDIGVFDITPMGLIYLGVGLAYLLTVGRRLVPDRHAGEDLAERFHLRDYVPPADDPQGGAVLLVEAVLAPSSRLLGSTLTEARCPQRYGIEILALRRHGHYLRGGLDQVHLDFGDSLLLQGTADAVQQLEDSTDFLLLHQISLPRPRRSKIPIAVGILAITVALMGTGAVPMVTGVVLGSLAMILTRCVSLREVYESFPFKVIVLLGCLIPLGLAVDKTGADDFVATKLVELPMLDSPRIMLLALALLTIALTEVMSNNATAVLIVPIAFAVAERLGVSPQPLVLGVMFTASFSFLTPVGYQTNTLIYGPGGYRFSDFARVGAPLTATLLVLTVFVVPAIWGF